MRGVAEKEPRAGASAELELVTQHPTPDGTGRRNTCIFSASDVVVEMMPHAILNSEDTPDTLRSRHCEARSNHASQGGVQSATSCVHTGNNGCCSMLARPELSARVLRSLLVLVVAAMVSASLVGVCVAAEATLGGGGSAVWLTESSTYTFYLMLLVLCSVETLQAFIQVERVPWPRAVVSALVAGVLILVVLAHLELLVLERVVSPDGGEINRAGCTKISDYHREVARGLCPGFLDRYGAEYFQLPLREATSPTLATLALLSEASELMESLLNQASTSVSTVDPEEQRIASRMLGPSCIDPTMDHFCETVFQRCAYDQCTPLANCSTFLRASERCGGWVNTSSGSIAPDFLGDQVEALLDDPSRQGITVVNPVLGADPNIRNGLEHLRMVTNRIVRRGSPTCPHMEPLNSSRVCAAKNVPTCDPASHCEVQTLRHNWGILGIIAIIVISAGLFTVSFASPPVLRIQFWIDWLRVISAVLGILTLVLVVSLARRLADVKSLWAYAYYAAALVTAQRGVLHPLVTTDPTAQAALAAAAESHKVGAATQKRRRPCCVFLACSRLIKLLSNVARDLMTIVDDPAVFEVVLFSTELIDWGTQLSAISASARRLDAAFVAANGAILGSALLFTSISVLLCSGVARFNSLLFFTSAFDKMYVGVAVLRITYMDSGVQDLTLAEHASSLFPTLATANMYFSARTALYKLAHHENASSTSPATGVLKRFEHAKQRILREWRSNRLFRCVGWISSVILPLAGIGLVVHSVHSFLARRHLCTEALGQLAVHANPRLYYSNGFWGPTTCAWAQVRTINASSCCNGNVVVLPEAPEVYASMVSLTSLDISDNHGITKIPGSWCRFPYLEQLNMQRSRILNAPACMCLKLENATSPLAASLAQLDATETPMAASLDWSRSGLETVELTPACVVAFGETLESLNLSRNAFANFNTQEFPQLKTSFPRLNNLDLSYNQIAHLTHGLDAIFQREDGFVALTGNPISRVRLFLLEGETIRRAQRTYQAAQLPLVTRVSLLLCNTSGVPSLLVDAFPNVQELSISLPSGFTALNMNLTSLHTVFWQNDNDWVIGWRHLAQSNLPAFRRLDLEFLEAVPVEELIRNPLPPLHSIETLLIVWGNSTFASWALFDRMAAALPNLRSLNSTNQLDLLPNPQPSLESLESLLLTRGVFNYTSSGAENITAPRDYCSCNVSKLRFYARLQVIEPFFVTGLSPDSESWLQTLLQTRRASANASSTWLHPFFFHSRSLRRVSLFMSSKAGMIAKPGFALSCAVANASTLWSSTFFQMRCPGHPLIGVHSCTVRNPNARGMHSLSHLQLLQQWDLPMGNGPWGSLWVRGAMAPTPCEEGLLGNRVDARHETQR